MTEERVVYTELNLPRSNKQKGKTRPAQKKRGFPWHSVAVFLGIMCFFLLLVIAGLGYSLFQSTCECEIQMMENMKERNATYTREMEYHSVLPPSTETAISTCQGKWSCCGESCYHFSKEEETWEKSKKSCQALDSSLVKIDDKDEQKFIQSQISYNHWIGLRKIGALQPWRWQNDGSQLSKALVFQWMPGKPEKTCGYLKSTTIANDVCNKVLFYICERSFTSLANKK